ncbi:MAG: hypothetical protein HQ515_18965 [Phycisphaeraceae bacterium]|nr:hypothetical protein [Phycisphaeraceae bacterium]
MPEDNTAVYAEIYGDTPLLAWGAGSGGEAEIDHYEVWLDGEQPAQYRLVCTGDLRTADDNQTEICSLQGIKDRTF